MIKKILFLSCIMVTLMHSANQKKCVTLKEASQLLQNDKELAKYHLLQKFSVAYQHVDNKINYALHMMTSGHQAKPIDEALDEALMVEYSTLLLNIDAQVTSFLLKRDILSRIPNSDQAKCAAVLANIKDFLQRRQQSPTE